MCGIVGIVHPDGCPIELQTLQRMTDVIAHRGPDDAGCEILSQSPFVAFGHRRLSIIDLSPAGHQPMANHDQSLWMVYNGEVYNYLSIRRELEGLGHRFKSDTDTEVILSAYQQWGQRCLDRLNGMFALAIWDDNKKQLFAARDRLGIKPFYYAITEHGLVFGSEIKALLASELVSPEVDWQALHNPWRFQVSPNTGFRSVRKLPPGFQLTYDATGLRTHSYWDIRPREVAMDESEAIEQIEYLLDDAVALQMIGDVPVGAFLSGGLDSSAIVALMAKRTSHSIRTFTIRFAEEDQRFEAMPDDSRYAAQVAQQFGCEHQELVIAPDIADLLPKVIWHMDEPLSDPAAVNTYLISEAARAAGVTVLLNGMGGDEIFGGYRKQQACLIAEKYQRIPAFARQAVSGLMEYVPVAGRRRGFKRARWAKRFISFADAPQGLRFLASDLSVSPSLYGELFQDAGVFPYADLPNTRSQLQWLERDDLSYLSRMCLADTKVFLPEHNLTYSDKMTMAASIESRPPMTDHRIVELMFSLPANMKIRGRIQKYALKRSMEKHLPRSIIHRAKAPFNSPLRSWIRGPLKPMVDDLLDPKSIRDRGLFNPVAVRSLIDSDRSGQADNAMIIWTLLTTELWFRTFNQSQTHNFSEAI